VNFVLDTDVCSYLLKRSHPVLIERVLGCATGELAVSAVTAFELHYGALRLPTPNRWMPIIDRFLQNFEVLPFQGSAARAAGEVRAELAAAGEPIGAYDLLIAGHVRALDATLVTNNTREFSRVPGLRIENWLD
jgi:tRNA(fMet)-specific endonuclease VapC